VSASLPSDQPTHAGGVVFREGARGREFLLIRPSSGLDQWVLPKGHIDPGETPEETAPREIREEAGVLAQIVRELARLPQSTRSGPALVVWYLMRFERETEPEEDRETAWFPHAEAIERASFENARELLRAVS
jgi:8-oxo-dGTP pyrophosphatase MutT (NUDIX family)